MESVSLKDIVSALRKAGIKAGDIVNCHSRLHAIGRIAEAKKVEDIPQFYLRVFQEILGEKGAVVVPTFTTSFARYGRPFVLEESPSEMGVFSEYVRRLPAARRTLHPVQSLAAVGGLASELTADHPPWNVGHNTIWDRLLKKSAKFVSIGVRPAQSFSFVHQAELLSCVPYLYLKILRGEVYAGGVPIEHDFLMAVRYLNFNIAYDLSEFERDLEKAGAVTQARLGGSHVWSVPLEAAFDIGIKGLKKNPYYFLRNAPSFVQGDIPCDGITIKREEKVHQYFLV